MEFKNGTVYSLLFNFAAVSDGDGSKGMVVTGGGGFNLGDYIHAFQHFAKDHVLAIQPGGRHGGDEKLGTIC